jgi:SAM-dependent methyltransferase
MRWVTKAVAFKLLSGLPGGYIIYRFAQRWITRSTVPTPGRILQKAQVGAQYLAALEALAPSRGLANVTHVDIGAGWMPTIPILFWTLGCDRQLLCDVYPNIDVFTLAGTVRCFRKLANEGRFPRSPMRLPRDVAPGETVQGYLSELGIRYSAPYDPSEIPAEPGWKLITCTQVLLHLRAAALPALFRAVAQALRGGGLFLATIRLYDLWSDFDPRVSAYNKFRYSDFIWERVLCSRLMYYNRLTVSDYRAAAAAAGLRILELRCEEPSEADIEELRKVRVHRKFCGVPEKELACRHLFIAASAV